MPVVHSKANGQFVKNGAGAGSKAIDLHISRADAAFIASGKNGTLPSQRVAKTTKKKGGGRKKSGGSKGKGSASKARKSMTKPVRHRVSAAYAKSQHTKQVHKATLRERRVRALEKAAKAPGATAVTKGKAKSARSALTHLNAEFDKTRGKTNALKKTRPASTSHSKARVATKPLRGRAFSAAPRHKPALGFKIRH